MSESIGKLSNLHEYVEIENEKTRVYTNGSGEVFVEFFDKNGQSSVILRISPDWDGNTVVTCATGLITPTSVNGLPAFRVSKRER